MAQAEKTSHASSRSAPRSAATPPSVQTLIGLGLNKIRRRSLPSRTLPRGAWHGPRRCKHLVRVLVDAN